MERKSQELQKEIDSKVSDPSSNGGSEQDAKRLMIINKSLDDASKQVKVKEAELNQLDKQLAQSSSMLNNDYLKRQNDLRVQMTG